MKRSWLIGAALLFSLSAVACSDDDDTISADASLKADGSVPSLDGSVGLDSGTKDAGAGDGGDSGR